MTNDVATAYGLQKRKVSNWQLLLKFIQKAKVAKRKGDRIGYRVALQQAGGRIKNCLTELEDKEGTLENQP